MSQRHSWWGRGEAGWRDGKGTAARCWLGWGSVRLPWSEMLIGLRQARGLEVPCEVASVSPGDRSAACKWLGSSLRGYFFLRPGQASGRLMGVRLFVKSLQLALLLGQQQAGGALLGLSSPVWPVVSPPPSATESRFLRSKPTDFSLALKCFSHIDLPLLSPCICLTSISWCWLLSLAGCTATQGGFSLYSLKRSFLRRTCSFLRNPLFLDPAGKHQSETMNYLSEWLGQACGNSLF